MMNLQRISLLLGILLLLNACTTPFSTVSINTQPVSNNVVLAGVLNSDSEALLIRDNALVVDLRTVAEEGVTLQAQQLKSAGVDYAHLPVGRSPLPYETVQSFQQLQDEHVGQPIVVHCASGNRAGILWAASLIEQGQSVEQAMRAVDKIVTKDSARQAIRAYANRRASQ